LRKAVKRQSRTASDAESDLSDEDNKVDYMEDIDSDAEDFVMTGLSDDRHELSQQYNYVGFR